MEFWEEINTTEASRGFGVEGKQEDALVTIKNEDGGRFSVLRLEDITSGDRG